MHGDGPEMTDNHGEVLPSAGSHVGLCTMNQQCLVRVTGCNTYLVQNQCFSFKILNKVRWWRCYMNCDRKTGGNEVKEKE